MDRVVGVGVIDDVSLGTVHALGEARPATAQPVQPHGGAVDQMDAVPCLGEQLALTAAEQGGEQAGEYAVRSRRVGVGQGRARDFLTSQVMQPARLAVEAADQPTQARGSRQLLKQQGGELRLAVQTAHPFVGLVSLDERVELAPGNVAQHLVKHGIMVRHGVDPSSCSDSLSPEPMPVESTPWTKYRKSNRTVVGQDPAMTAEGSMPKAAGVASRWWSRGAVQSSRSVAAWAIGAGPAPRVSRDRLHFRSLPARCASGAVHSTQLMSPGIVLATAARLRSDPLAC